MKTFSIKHTVLSVAFLSIGVWTMSVLRKTLTLQYFKGQHYEQVYVLPPPEVLLPSSLGFRRATADLIWMRSLVYYGQELVHKGSMRFAFGYAESMAQLDPKFLRIYKWIGTAALYKTTEATLQDAERAAAFLERGCKIFPDNPALIWETGATYAFELVPFYKTNTQKRHEAIAKGTHYLMQAARMGYGPSWQSLSNANLLMKLGQTEMAIRHLKEMEPMIDDEDTKRRIKERIRVLEGYIEQKTREERERESQHATP